MFFWLIILGLAVYYFYQKGSLPLKSISSAEETLKDRYVRGEIDEATYLHMKETLKK